jgi:hypothetical protein
MVSGPRATSAGAWRAADGGSSPGRLTHTAAQRGQRTTLPASPATAAGISTRLLHFGHRIEIPANRALLRILSAKR